jgi:integrase
MDDIVRELGAAQDSGPRVRHVGEDEHGHRVTTRTSKPVHQVRGILKRKAVEASIMALSEDELSTVVVDAPEPERDPVPALQHLQAITAVRNKTARPANPVDLSPRPTVEEVQHIAKGQIHQWPASPSPHTGVAPWQHPTQQVHAPGPWMGHVIQSDVRLSDRYPVYLAYLQQKKTSRSCTLGGLWTLRILTELVGDKRLCEVGPADVDVFLQAISVWPPHASKRREYRLMKAPDVVKKAMRLGDKPIDLGTQQRHIDLLRTLFRWLEARHEVMPGLLKGVRLYSSTDDRGQRRMPFDAPRLAALFDAKRDVKFTTPFQYWARYLGLYQGMRVNEIGQLYLDDIVDMDGVWCIDITRDRDGQRLKNAQSRRTVPIHPMLLENGFLEFVEQSRRWGRVTLFPGLVWGVNGPGDTISDWFNRSFLRKVCGIKVKTMTFHSLRHNFATVGERSGLSDARVALMLGHSAGDSILRKHYVMRLSVDEMKESMSKMRFQKLEHVPYVPEQYERAFQRAAAVEAREARLEQVYGRVA